ncbi:Splicing factor 3B subunit 4, partial [Fragariocoptes setiger]
MVTVQERNQDATIYVGSLDEQVTESLLCELFVQAGPVVSVHMPKDRVTGAHQGYGFVEFMSEDDADYAIKIMNMIKLYGKPIRVNKASAYQKNLDIGANIFIGNLDPEVDEKLLYDTFSAFGVILQTPKVMRDMSTGNARGFAFINFASFEASDAAIEAMNGQFLCNRPITISYAFKKDSKSERHGTIVERLLAQKNKLIQSDRPNRFFADAPPSTQSNGSTGMAAPTPSNLSLDRPNVPLTRPGLAPPSAPPRVVPMVGHYPTPMHGNIIPPPPPPPTTAAGIAPVYPGMPPPINMFPIPGAMPVPSPMFTPYAGYPGMAPPPPPPPTIDDPSFLEATLPPPPPPPPPPPSIEDEQEGEGENDETNLVEEPSHRE